jgi:hypothetical protein
MFDPESEDFSPPANLSPDFVLDSNLRQLMIGDYVFLPSITSVVDRGMVVNIHGSMVEFMILVADTGVPETIVLDLRRPDEHSGLFGRYGYVGVTIVARKNEASARDFAAQLLAACEETRHQNQPRLNPFLVAQAKMRVDFLREILRLC